MYRPLRKQYCQLPDDREALGRLVRNVSIVNARNYFGFPLGKAAA